MPENIKSEITKKRVFCFIDGFNLYHAIDRMGKNHLKWLNLRTLMEHFTGPEQYISSIYYFSAYAEWLKDKAARHKIYTTALKSVGVIPIMGNFKEKPLSCFRCNNTWMGHEEKQTDVNIAISLVREAFNNNYDEAFLVSCDSDYTPALQLVQELPKKRKIKLISPPGLKHSKQLAKYASKLSSIKEIHLERSLFSHEIKDGNGVIFAKRPGEYDPPV